jgi:hypothetical protein
MTPEQDAALTVDYILELFGVTINGKYLGDDPEDFDMARQLAIRSLSQKPVVRLADFLT